MGYPKIPDITCEDIEKIYQDQERWRKEQPCCQNCIYYYNEFGTDLCKIDGDMPENWQDKCKEWR